MKTKLFALALVLGALTASQASAGALYDLNGRVLGYTHTGAYSGGWGVPANWSFDCRYGYYVPSYY